MIWAIVFYWVCAGLASFQIGMVEGRENYWMILFGGVAIPVRILSKLAM